MHYYNHQRPHQSLENSTSAKEVLNQIVSNRSKCELVYLSTSPTIHILNLQCDKYVFKYRTISTICRTVSRPTSVPWYLHEIEEKAHDFSRVEDVNLIATAPNTIVFRSRYITIPQMAKIGLVLTLPTILVISAFAIWWIALVWS